MKRTIIIATALSVMASVTEAQTVVEGVGVSDFNLCRSGSYLTVDMTLDLTRLDVRGNRAVLLTPRLVNGADSLDLPSVGIYGRRRYYHYLRNGEEMISGSGETSYKVSRKPESLEYDRTVPYEDWMNGAELSLHRSDYGCCHTLLSQQDGFLGSHAEAFFPYLVYVRPQAEMVKHRSIEGSAYIDFPVDETTIYPDYRNNKTELGKIRSTIDSVRNDLDIAITAVSLKGYASPESPYDHNRELAEGRTEALKSYIGRLYSFDEGIIEVAYEPENWEGLRRYVESSDLEHRREILAIIDSDREPDNKEWKLKSTYSDEYRRLLRDCYPALRRTDYRIAYTIRGYSDADEIERVLRSQPQKLSLNEIYIVAQKYEPGSDEFTEIFETAVRMYPDDETANLNAANAAMRRGDNAAAARYLVKAGESPEAVYARGALAIRTEDYDTARRYLVRAQRLGLEQASATLAELDRGRRK